MSPIYFTLSCANSAVWWCRRVLPLGVSSTDAEPTTQTADEITRNDPGQWHKIYIHIIVLWRQARCSRHALYILNITFSRRRWGTICSSRVVNPSKISSVVRRKQIIFRAAPLVCVKHFIKSIIPFPESLRVQPARRDVWLSSHRAMQHVSKASNYGISFEYWLKFPTQRH